MTACQPRTRRTHNRSVAILIRPTAGQPAMLIRITQDDKAAHYWLTEARADFGRYFKLEKPGHEGTESYDVHLDAVMGDSCNCPGHTFGNFCKHVDAVNALLRVHQL
jgi:hypothetical protein